LASVGRCQVAFTGGAPGHKPHIVSQLGHTAGSSPAPPAKSTGNVAVAEKTLDGHVDDLVWANRDGTTLFLVGSGRGLGRGGGLAGRHTLPLPPPCS
jgi:hypothetical protein